MAFLVLIEFTETNSDTKATVFLTYLMLNLSICAIAFLKSHPFVSLMWLCFFVFFFKL